MAGVTGFEPAIDGFGVRRSSNRASPLHFKTLVGADGFEPPWAVRDQQGYSLPVSAAHARTQCQRTTCKTLAEGWRVERQPPEGATVQPAWELPISRAFRSAYQDKDDNWSR